METYTYKCKECGAALEYDPKADIFQCQHCFNFYSVEELPTPEEITDTKPFTRVMSSDLDNDPYMNVNVYHCSSCGAEIMTNDVEISKFCSYCGQPTIIFDRISKELKPQKIIPFSISRDEALRIAKQTYSEGIYTLGTEKELNPESVFGIYMPYYAYSASMSILARIEIKNDKRTETYNPRVHMNHTVLLDASERFNDYVSKQLNPFPFESAVKFHTGYLSGFYADRCDNTSGDRIYEAKAYMREILEEKAWDSLPKEIPRQTREMYGNLLEKTGAARFNIINEDFTLFEKNYIFCPVYLITYRIQNTLIILLINGCSGKIVGSIPIDKKKVKKRQLIDVACYSLVMGILGLLLFSVAPLWWSTFIFSLLTISYYLLGVSSKKKYERMFRATNSKTMFALSSNRK